MPSSHQDAITACLLGGAVGDAIGLPYEGLSTRRARRLARLPLRHRFCLGRGMISDDTDHSIFVLQSLILARNDARAFGRTLAWRLRWWLLCLPAGIGMATLRAIIRLWLGYAHSGVHSAGNGPSMRSAIIGAVFCDQDELRRQYVEQSTRLTHTDGRALAGALAVAEVAARVARGNWRSRPPLAEFANVLESVSENREWLRTISRIQEDCLAPQPVEAALERFGSAEGVSGYTLHAVPFALVVWYHHFGNYRATIEAVTQAGGDVDTVGAIAGALAGCVVGERGIPRSWSRRVCDWPHSTSYMRRLASKWVNPHEPVRTAFSPALFPRGIVFTVIVLIHGFRRLLPPY